ncbi:Pre-mRNA-splicing factor slt11 [Malassezia cuniculi]|uniref:Pre-mRNA-splicing factor slt11 n=1 Tax=Malassezia cuniculi TaxID=948313 RepID=A0AAF0J695_9BASI|nr:Pre-mRNA-splicing factor slt11 [Malassezia cuniculi]
MSYNFLNKQGAANPNSAEAETPILCDSCLGPNPYVRMSKQRLGNECKICGRPFTVFRWNPGTGMRFKKTEICTTCAKLKNVCQSCILDLEYGLPTHVRDSALGIESRIPTSETNRQYYVNHIEARLEGATAATSAGTPSAAGPASRKGHELLQNLAREPDYKRNRPQLCSFFARGTCSRGDACPYRHEIPAGTLQNVGEQQSTTTSTSVSTSRIVRAQDARPLVTPADTSITTLFFTSLPESVGEEQLRNYIVAAVPRLSAADLESIKHIAASRCAFVSFATRDWAEAAAQALATKVEVDGKPIRVAWGRARKETKQA